MNLIYLLSLLGVMLIGITVRVHSRKLAYTMFSLFSYSLSIFILFQFLATINFLDRSILWIQLSFLVSELLAGFFLLFTYLYPDKNKLPKSIIVVSLTPILALGWASFSNLLIENINFSNFQNFRSGPLYNLQSMVIVAYIIAGLAIMLAKSYRAKGGDRQKLLILLLAIIVPAVVLAITGMDDAGVELVQALRPISVFVMTVLATYAIIYKRLFDIRATVARTLAYLLSFGILIALYALVVFGVSSFVSLGADLTHAQRIFYIGIALVFAITLPRLKRIFDKLSNKLFYQDAYDVQDFIDELNKTIVSDIQLRNLLKSSAEVIQSNLKTEFVTFGIKQTESLPQQIIGSSSSVERFKQADITKVRSLTPDINQKVIITDELEMEHSELKDILLRYNIGMLVRLATDVGNGKEGIGYIVLGYKRSGSPFNGTDIKTVEIISNSMVVAIQNSMRFEEIQHFSITLQKKVDDATRQLERTNKKLVAMDETKDEFISMASHQLRTPLTSVKGFISMLLDGDFGKITPKQREILKETFASSQRMVYLIADFLNVSRIRTGKFVIELTEVDLSEIITQELSQLQEMAASREVTLKFEAPADFPKAMLDENKIRQVMMNFIDNAIYYTPKEGTTNIQLYKTAKDIVYKVIDNGIGVPKSEQHKLFTKFFRAKNAQKARPDGTGLGLFMAQKVIVAQGGSIIFESTEGKGSTFGFSFPLSKVKPVK